MQNNFNFLADTIKPDKNYEKFQNLGRQYKLKKEKEKETLRKQVQEIDRVKKEKLQAMKKKQEEIAKMKNVLKKKDLFEIFEENE